MDVNWFVESVGENMLSAIGSIASQSGVCTYKRYNATPVYGVVGDEQTRVIGSGSQKPGYTVRPTWGGVNYTQNGSFTTGSSGTLFQVTNFNPTPAYEEYPAGISSWTEHYRVRPITSYTQGSYIDTVVVPTAQYPANGQQGGYWYVLQ